MELYGTTANEAKLGAKLPLRHCCVLTDNIVVAVGQVPDDIPTDTAGVTALSSRGWDNGRIAG